MSDFQHNQTEAISLLRWIGDQLLPLIRKGQFEGLSWRENCKRVIASSDEIIQQALDQLHQLARDPEAWFEDPAIRRVAALRYEEFSLLLALLQEYRVATMRRLHEQGEPI